VQPVRFGFLSTARINRAVLAGARATEVAEVVAVGSRDPQRAEAYAAENDIERSYGSYDDLLVDPDIEAIYISLPNSLHVGWSVLALEAGKHVLVEKPFDRRPKDVARAFDVAADAGLVLMEAFMYRHHPQTKKLQEVVASGAIGELRQLRSSFSFTLDDPGDVRMTPDLDGGSLMDLGCYCISISRLLAGEPVHVVGRQRTGPSGIDLGFAGVLEFAGGVLADFHCAFDLPYEAGLEAIGSAGRVVVAEPFSCFEPHLDVNGDRVDVEDVDRYALQVENFSLAVRGEAEPLIGRDDAVGQARVIEALYRSAATGAAVSL
jgi:D-xylose 1-dehydrogenase (NADP+, D-xylono-1,5-lactone-forming)